MKAKKASLPQADARPTRLSRSDPASLEWQIQNLQLAVARRAYELFEARGGEHGHDWEDWFQAEAELLRPVSVSLSESEDRISVRANVLGFDESELQVSVEPRRVTILGKKEMSMTESEGGKIEYVDWYPDQLLQFIDLPGEVAPDRSTVELQAGLLRCELPRAAAEKIATTGIAA